MYYIRSAYPAMRSYHTSSLMDLLHLFVMSSSCRHGLVGRSHHLMCPLCSLRTSQGCSCVLHLLVPIYPWQHSPLCPGCRVGNQVFPQPLILQIWVQVSSWHLIGKTRIWSLAAQLYIGSGTCTGTWYTMGGISGEVGGLEEVDILGSSCEQLQLQGVYKMVNISGTVSRIDSKF